MSLAIWVQTNVDTGGSEPHRVTLYSGNVTHNLGKMAAEAGVYKAVWCLDEYMAELHGEEKLPTAEWLSGVIEEGLKDLRDRPMHYKQFNPANGWGDYEGFVEFLGDYLTALKTHPKAFIEVWK